MKKCYIYTRVSTEIQVDGYSLDAQNAELERYAKANNIKICGRYQDAGKSGKDIKGRPEFQRMLEDIANGNGEVDFVLVFKLSRFARSAADALNALGRLKEQNVDLICVEEGLDTSTVVGKLVFTIISAVCEMERDNIRVQTMEGRKEKARQGKWNGGAAPYGYTINEDDVLEVIEGDREAIKMIFKLYVESGWGFNKIAKYLNNTGITKNIHTNERELTAWSDHMVRNIIDNEVYCGKMPYGKRTMKNIQGEEKRVFTDDYITAEGLHEAIVPEEVWLAAQRRREQTKGKREKIVGLGREHLLTGILKCPECGSPMYATRRGKDESKMLYYYKCSRQMKVTGHECSYTRQLRQEEVNEQVFQAIVSLIDCRQFAEEVDEKLQKEVDKEELDRNIQGAKKELNNINNNKASLEMELDSLPADIPHYERKREDMKKRLDRLYDKLEAQERFLRELQIRKKNIEEGRIKKDMVYEFLKNFKSLYGKMTDEEKRRFYKLLIEKIELYKEPLGNGQMVKSISFQFPIVVAEGVNGNPCKESGGHSGRDKESRMRLTVKAPELEIQPIRPATYTQIREYVKELHGVSVHTSHIAEVKRKCGLDMRKNYNVSKKNAPKKPCTKEKEAYIKEALRHFGMI